MVAGMASAKETTSASLMGGMASQTISVSLGGQMRRIVVLSTAYLPNCLISSDTSWDQRYR